jgi:cell wall-associated NlpC family hydrolase
MPIQRLTAATLFAAACIFQSAAFAHIISPAKPLECDAATFQASSMPFVNAGQWSTAQNIVLTTPAAHTSNSSTKISLSEIATIEQAPRHVLADFAMQLRNIRYRRGGREPSTGFDCSGFVHYVFLHTMGLDLPGDAPGQYGFGQKVARTQMQTGDLVFFHTRGGAGISHVGIYLDDGRFIHSPSPGKSVRIDRLEDAYWTKRFVGARRLGSLS